MWENSLLFSRDASPTPRMSYVCPHGGVLFGGTPGGSVEQRPEQIADTAPKNGKHSGVCSRRVECFNRRPFPRGNHPCSSSVPRIVSTKHEQYQWTLCRVDGTRELFFWTFVWEIVTMSDCVAETRGRGSSKCVFFQKLFFFFGKNVFELEIHSYCHPTLVFLRSAVVLHQCVMSSWSWLTTRTQISSETNSKA